MADPLNPYAPPSAPLQAPPLQVSPDSPGVWREGDVLVVNLDSELPCRCVKCNEPAEEPVKLRTLYWHHPAIYLVVLVNILIYAIVALIVRKKATLNPGLCAAHRKRRGWAMVLGWGGSILGFILAIASLANDSCGMGFLGALLFLGCMIGGLMMARIVYPVKMDSESIRLKGCGKAFLDSLPGYRG